MPQQQWLLTEEIVAVQLHFLHGACTSFTSTPSVQKKARHFDISAGLLAA